MEVLLKMMLGTNLGFSSRKIFVTLLMYLRMSNVLVENNFQMYESKVREGGRGRGSICPRYGKNFLLSHKFEKNHL
jgi:hypothetical protein